MHRSKIFGSGKEWAVFLLSLFLACAVWFIHSMSLRYTVPVKFRVSIVTDLEGYAPEAVSGDVLVAGVTGTGFTIVGLRHSASSVRGVNLKVSGSKLTAVAGQPNLFEASPRELGEELYQALGAKVTINSYDTDRLTFKLTPRRHRKVPVVLQSEIYCKSQYMTASDIRLTPDSVAVYGDAAIIDNVAYVESEPVSEFNVDAPITGKVRLKPINGVEMSASQVEYHIDIVRYVELSAEVEFSPLGGPEGEHMLINPSSGTVRYRIPYNLASGEVNPPAFVVYYSDFAASRSGAVVPALYSAPEGMLSYELDPPAVECMALEL